MRTFGAPGMRSFKYHFILLGIIVVVLVMIRIIGKYPWLLLIPVALVIGLYPLQLFRQKSALRRKGYYSDGFVYWEIRDGKVLSICIPREPVESGVTCVVVPTRAEWDRIASDWAKGRRDELFQRVFEHEPIGSAYLPKDWPRT